MLYNYDTIKHILQIGVEALSKASLKVLHKDLIRADVKLTYYPNIALHIIAGGSKCIYSSF